MISAFFGLILLALGITLWLFPQKLQTILPPQLLPQGSNNTEPYTNFVLTVHFGHKAADLVAVLDWEFLPTDNERVAGLTQAIRYHEREIIACNNYGDIADTLDDALWLLEDQDIELRDSYLNAPDTPASSEPIPDGFSPTENVVITLNMVYKGEMPVLEKEFTSSSDLGKAFSAIYGLAKNERIVKAIIYKLPAHPHHNLTDDQVLINFQGLKKV